MRLYGSDDRATNQWTHIPTWHDFRVTRWKLEFQPVKYRYLKIEFSNLVRRRLMDLSLDSVDDPGDDTVASGRAYAAYPPILLDEFRRKSAERTTNLLDKVEDIWWRDESNFDNKPGGHVAGYFAHVMFELVNNNVLSVYNAAQANRIWADFEGVEDRLINKIRDAREQQEAMMNSPARSKAGAGPQGHTLFWAGNRHHNYEYELMTTPTTALYFIALREIRIWKTTYVDKDDPRRYYDPFSDNTMIDLDLSEIVPSINGYLDASMTNVDPEPILDPVLFNDSFGWRFADRLERRRFQTG